MFRWKIEKIIFSHKNLRSSLAKLQLIATILAYTQFYGTLVVIKPARHFFFDVKSLLMNLFVFPLFDYIIKLINSKRTIV